MYTSTHFMLLPLMNLFRTITSYIFIIILHNFETVMPFLFFFKKYCTFEQISFREKFFIVKLYRHFEETLQHILRWQKDFQGEMFKRRQRERKTFINIDEKIKISTLSTLSLILTNLNHIL